VSRGSGVGGCSDGEEWLGGGERGEWVGGGGGGSTGERGAAPVLSVGDGEYDHESATLAWGGRREKRIEIARGVRGEEIRLASLFGPFWF
jgi:hypothetical protein